MLKSRDLPRLLTESRFRLKTVNRWSISDECQPWLRRMGQLLLDRLVRVRPGSFLFGLPSSGSADPKGLDLELKLESLAGDSARWWALASSTRGASKRWWLLEVSSDGQVGISAALDDLPQSLARAAQLRLAFLGDRLWLIPISGGLYDIEGRSFITASSDDTSSSQAAGFFDERGPGYLKFDERLCVYRFAPALGECVEWRRRGLSLRLNGLSCRQLVPLSSGWLGVLVQPSPRQADRWLHRFVSLDDRLALRGVSLPFTLDEKGRLACQDLLPGLGNDQIVMTYRKPQGKPLDWISWRLDNILNELDPCSPGDVEFPNPAAVARLRSLGREIATP